MMGMREIDRSLKQWQMEVKDEGNPRSLTGVCILF